jgi:transposase
MIREAAGSGLSIRAFCRQRRLKESRFYWWQRRLRGQQDKRRPQRGGPVPDTPATFALVSDQPGALESGIELVLADGRRVRIGQGVDAETLRTVLAVLGSAGC